MPVRPSAVRGALRSWFRAAAAALMPVEDGRGQERMLGRLYEAESRVFGNTKQRSAVIVRPPVGLDQSSIERYGKTLPDKNQWPGLRYLGYGAFGSDEVQFVKPGPQFGLGLSVTRPIEGLVELVSATVWLWLHLGGLGARVRRGFGSLRLHGAEGLVCPDDLQALVGPSELAAHLRRGVDWALGVFRDHLPSLVVDMDLGGAGATHPGLRTLDDLGEFVVLPPYRSGDQALEQAGRLFRDFRSTLRRRDLGLPPLPDYFAVKDAVARRETPRQADRAAFGLPLRYYFRSLNGQSTWVLPRKRGQRKPCERLASPLSFRVHVVGEGAQHVTTMFHMARNKGPLDGLELVERRGDRAIPKPSVEILEQFLEWAQREARRRPGGRS